MEEKKEKKRVEGKKFTYAKQVKDSGAAVAAEGLVMFMKNI